MQRGEREKKYPWIYQGATSQNKLHNHLERKLRQAVKQTSSLSLTLPLMEQKLMGRCRHWGSVPRTAELHKSHNSAVSPIKYRGVQISREMHRRVWRQLLLCFEGKIHKWIKENTTTSYSPQIKHICSTCQKHWACSCLLVSYRKRKDVVHA